ncbi:MAG: hypothetical protein A2664_00910 [Candidatus Taylorbacteria bacterium RIFCSPHIGHO2_01_FULL_46_22b]|uniref:Uncharacterized protein n=1 Tax=Candidatus Taylorbacteria bacterium RIFCSPHIGHO2_01_FULL_46_22b TaxID=1802301 RepID=A0A1G2M5U1_9BACT|nr:MAG: hypothetical protein A2664_00910 [Candidatus Taylorbacteria bacterium RIFCSPHIGHO2_01_FULL_46_22b]
MTSAVFAPFAPVVLSKLANPTQPSERHPVRTARDIPEHVFDAIRMRFPTVTLRGELPDHGGNVMVGRELTWAEVHPEVHQILMHHGCVAVV